MGSWRHRELRSVLLVANPAASRGVTSLPALERALEESGVAWETAVTGAAGEGRTAAENASRRGFDAVAAYGGDGTVREVAAGLAARPGAFLVILPGGTANLLASELGIPTDPLEALSLAFRPHSLRRLDVGEACGSVFVLRVGIGWQAETVESTSEEMKASLGVLAYVFSGVRGLTDAKPVRYRMWLDGSFSIVDGVSCTLTNAGALGVSGVRLRPGISIEDGLLDVVILRSADVASLASVAASVLAGEPSELLWHRKAREIRLEASPRQAVVLDGEEAGVTPVEAKVSAQGVVTVAPSVSGTRMTREQGVRV